MARADGMVSGGALQVRDGFGARARIGGQDRAQNQVRLRRAGIQAERGAHGVDRFRQCD